MPNNLPQTCVKFEDIIDFFFVHKLFITNFIDEYVGDLNFSHEMRNKLDYLTNIWSFKHQHENV